MARFLRPFLLEVFSIVLLATGCGSPGAPAPPSLNLATPVHDLSASRIADSVHLTWTMPSQTTDRVAIHRVIRVELCRQLESGPCTAVAALDLGAGKTGSYTDALPADLARGPARLLEYRIYLRNRTKKSAGPSNPAFTGAGAPPPALTGLTAEVRREGVLLSWHPASGTSVRGVGSILYRIQRLLIQQTPSPSPGSKTVVGEPAPPSRVEPPLAAQTLVVEAPSGIDPGHALDTNVQLNQRYRYTVERVTARTLSGHPVEIQGAPSDPVFLRTTDIFPPTVPHGLAAVADVAGGAIDLSWVPDTDSDLAGYLIYRRDLATTLPSQRISPPGILVSAPGFRDTAVERGHTYAYSVSAVNQNGNESARSRETTETLPKAEPLAQ